MVRQLNEQNAIRRYLLKQLSASEQETVEFRLLSDDAFSEELDIVEDELIDEYLANELSRKERKQFENTFLASPNRQQKFKAAQAVNRYFGRSSPQPMPAPSRFEILRRWLTPFPLRIGVPVAIVALIVFGGLIWRGAFSQSDLQKGLVALNEAFRQQRPVEARVSNLDHAPFIVPRGNEPEKVNTLERDRAQVLLSDAFKKRADAASYHALGKLYLLKKDPNKAIEYLEQAKQGDGNNAQILADLGAAYLEKGKLELESATSDPSSGGKGIEDLGRSLEYLKQALELNPNLLEAMFNRALVHQYQGLNQLAEGDWRSYLEKDPNSEWAKEAQQRLQLLEEKKKQSSERALDPAEAFLQAYRARDDDRAWDLYKRRYAISGNKITNALIDRVLGNNTDTQESLQALNYLGQLENRKTQDAYTSDLAKVYVAISPQSRSMLLEARQQIDEGYRLSGESKFGEAIELLTKARQTLDKLNDLPESLAAEKAIAHAAAVQPDLAKGQDILSRLIPISEARHYKWLLADCLSRQSHINSNLNNYSQAFNDANRALHLFQELDDVANVFGQLLQLAGAHLFLHDIDNSLACLQRALTLSDNEAIAVTDSWGLRIAISLT
jgi:hypothetical protein